MAADGNTVVVAYNGPPGTGVYLARSSDGGATFENDKIVLIDPEADSTAGLSVVGHTIYVGYGTTNYEVRLARSDNGGETFDIQTVATNAFAAAMMVSGDAVHIAYEPLNASVEYQRSDDRGNTWSEPVGMSWGGVAFSPMSLTTNGGVLFASFYDTILDTQTIAHSSDSGKTWTEEPGQAGLLATGRAVMIDDRLLIPAATLDNTLVVSGSQDSGATWTNQAFAPPGGAFGDNPLDSINDFTIAGVRLAATGTTMYAIFPQGALFDLPTRLGFARSTDLGVTWPATDVSTLFKSAPETVGYPYLTEHADIVISTGETPAILVAFYDGLFYEGHLRILRSTDAGATWQ
jgi:hypothetical protein